MRSAGSVIVAVLAALGLTVLAVSPVRAASTVHVHYAMDDAPGATTGADDAGSDQPADLLGSGLSTGDGSWHFSRIGTGAQAVASNSTALNPGDSDFSFQVSVRTQTLAENRTYNVAQKGLATAPDNWKMEVDTAHGAGHAGTPVLSCVFDGATRKVRVVSKTTFAPGTWTTLRCGRSGNALTATVNGITTSKAVTVGSINNSSSLVLGAKKLNDVDTYLGAMDEAVYSIG